MDHELHVDIFAADESFECTPVVYSQMLKEELLVVLLDLLSSFLFSLVHADVQICLALGFMTTAFWLGCNGWPRGCFIIIRSDSNDFDQFSQAIVFLVSGFLLLILIIFEHLRRFTKKRYQVCFRHSSTSKIVCVITHKQ